MTGGDERATRTVNRTDNKPIRIEPTSSRRTIGHGNEQHLQRDEAAASLSGPKNAWYIMQTALYLHHSWNSCAACCTFLLLTANQRKINSWNDDHKGAFRCSFSWQADHACNCPRAGVELRHQHAQPWALLGTTNGTYVRLIDNMRIVNKKVSVVPLLLQKTTLLPH